MLEICTVRQDCTLLCITKATSLALQLFNTVLLQSPTKIAVSDVLLILS